VPDMAGMSYENISKEAAKEYVEELRCKVMELALPHRYSKMLPIVTITQGMYCDVPKQENRVWDYLHVADEILYSVKTDSRGGCRVADRAEFVLMSGYGNMIQAQA
jgi:PleD family two-component response regulator